jgi:hypothetical protein
MDAFWELSWRLYPALVLLAAGALLAARGDVLLVRGARMKVGTPRKNLTWIRGFRLSLFGASLAAVAAGWAWHIPALVAAGLVIGFEETLETSIVAHALKQSGE